MVIGGGPDESSIGLVGSLYFELLPFLAPLVLLKVNLKVCNFKPLNSETIVSNFEGKHLKVELRSSNFDVFPFFNPKSEFFLTFENRLSYHSKSGWLRPYQLLNLLRL